MNRISTAPALAWCLVAAAAATAAETPLDEYVRKADPAYSWEVVSEKADELGTTFVVRLRSQTWLTPDEVDRPLWEHWLTVYKPTEPAGDTAFLLIGGGSNGRPAPQRAGDIVRQVGVATGSVVAELGQIPNQPLEFHGDGVQRVEDDLIAYAWARYLKTGDSKWLPRLPMVKSAVRAMDCIQELLAGEKGGGFKVEKFIVGGGSKRGWTTWLTGAADPRVAAIVPIVIDVLNVEESMRNHLAAYGFWAEAVGNYYQHGVMSAWGDPRLEELYSVVDPLRYRDRLTMPKYVVNASGDQFFTPDSSAFYFDQLEGPKLLRYVPNADHSLRDSDATLGVIAFHHAVTNGKPLPEYGWEFTDEGIRVEAKGRPLRATLWTATNPEARDFRVKTIGRAYRERRLSESEPGVYVAEVPPPQKGWTAAFVELTYDLGGPFPLKVSTGVRISPDRLPFADLPPNEGKYENEPRR